MCSTSLGLAVVPGEVEHQRFVGVRLPAGRERGWRIGRLGVRQPARRLLTDRDRVLVPGTSSNFAVSASRTSTWRTRPRATRSRRSAGPSSGVAGDDDGAQLHRGERGLPTARPGCRASRGCGRPPVRPCALSQLAARSERSDIAAKDTSVRRPSSSTMCRAVRSLFSAMTSNQSSAQLKWSARGQRRSRCTPARSPRGAPAGSPGRPGTSRSRWLPTCALLITDRSPTIM